jgi:ring-1,2-phenylacetyl-CoA epoxidase subunit PaaD
VNARDVVATVVDPELPMLTLDDLGVIRSVTETASSVDVVITPTYSGCPAVEAMQADIRSGLLAAGYAEVSVRTSLSPPWTTDLISAEGRRKLAEAGIAPPGPVSSRADRRGTAGAGRLGPVPLVLSPAPPRVPCPRCGEPDTEEISRFGATACTSLRRCPACREPFEHVRPL